jgi:hypothetical protein
LIQQLESLFYDSKQQGMMVAIRIMLYYQRVGLYYRKARDTALGTDAGAQLREAHRRSSHAIV